MKTLTINGIEYQLVEADQQQTISDSEHKCRPRKRHERAKFYGPDNKLRPEYSYTNFIISKKIMAKFKELCIKKRIYASEGFKKALECYIDQENGNGI